MTDYRALVGLRAASPPRVVTEEDVIGFARLSGDFNRLHTDAAFASGTSFGRQIAHGLLTTSIASGLFTATPLSRSLEPDLVAMLGVTARFHAPVFFGDSLRLDARITAARPRTTASGYLLMVERTVSKADGTVVQTIETPLLMRGDGDPPGRSRLPT